MATAIETSVAVDTRPLPPARTSVARGRRRTVPTLAMLARIRHALLDHPLDDALPMAANLLAQALAPAHVELWLADQMPWLGALPRAGGQELFPALRLRAAAAARAARDPAPAAYPATHHPGPLVEDVLALRHPIVLAEAANDPLAQAWAATAAPALPALDGLAAYPLQVRGQFLGVLVAGTARTFDPADLALLEATADHCALAAAHDRLLSYSRGQEALAQTVVRHAPVAVAVLAGPDHVFTLANPAFEQLLGLAHSPHGQRLDDIAPDAARLRDTFRLDAVYLTGEPQAMIELPLHLERGLTYWNVTISPLPGRGSQRVAGVLVAAIDVTPQVTARQRAQEAANVAQERIGQMMALHATSLAVTSQLGADPRELLADILRRSMTLLNARAGVVYVMGQRARALEAVVCQGLRVDRIGMQVRIGEGLAGQVAHTGQGLLVDDIRLYPEGSALYAGEAVSAAIAVPLVSRHQIVGVLEALDDADRHVFTRDDLWLLELFAAQAAQAIENARTYVALEHAYQAQREIDRFKDDFIATAAHELRSPLTGVRGFLDLLLDYSGSRDEPMARAFLQQAAAAATELSDLTERLLETSRLDAGRVELCRAPVDARALATEVLRAHQATQTAAPIPHTFVADIPEDVRVLADPDRLKEVLDNLVSNAVKYSPAGGTVRVACALDEAGAPPGHAVILVSDQGIGIAAAERDRLFERFARLDAARSREIRGTGLGLYICRQLVQAMGGRIWLHASAPGQGSTFAIALPCADAADPSRPPCP